MRTKTILILATLLLAALWSYGQQWQTIDMRDGLSESRVRRIAQMPDGRMAIATTATIDIYDFTRFTAYKLSPDYAYPLPEYAGDRQLNCDTLGNIFLRGNRSLYILDTRHQRLIANVDSMLKALQLTPQQVVSWPIESADSMPAIGRSDVMTAVRDSYGGLWIGTKESGILYSNPDRQRQFHTFADSAFVFKRRPNFCSPRTSQLSANCEAASKQVNAFPTADGKGEVNVADGGLRRISILYVVALHQFKSGAALCKRKDICAQTSTGIVVLLVTTCIEVADEELAHLLQIPTKKCGVVNSHFAAGVKSLCFSHSRTGRS